MSFAVQADASVAGEGWGLMLPTAPFVRHHHWQAGFAPGSRVHVNAAGRRFMDEDASYAVSPGLLETQGGEAWMGFGGEARAALPAGYADWNADNVLAMVKAGAVTQAGSLAGLAGKIGVPAGALRGTA